MPDWNSALYLKFEKERTRAACDLLVQISDIDPRRVVDLGCGPGNSTQLLAATYPNATITGLDASDDMLTVARASVAAVDFIKADIRSWRPPEKLDLIFANAALHFLPDHQELMPRLMSFLNDGGCLAVQMPNNIHELSHALMRMVATEGPWASRLVPIAKTRAVIGGVDQYYQLIAPICSQIDLWQTTYVHPLDGVDEIVEWFEGSPLRPFLELLNANECELFLLRYRSELAAAYPRQPNGKVLLRYPRLFFVARK
jgi:trans-aconitate 2-methyltransferase